jgi:hypothetical protein
MATVTAPIGQGLNSGQWETWFKNNTKTSPVVVSTTAYHGTQLKGKSWAQVYGIIYAFGVASKTPVPNNTTLADAAAAATISTATLDGVAIASSDIAGAAGAATNASAQGIIKAANSNFGLPSIPNPLGSVVDFLQGLTSANLWIRVAKIIAGGAILIVGLVKLTGADKKAGGLAAKAVKVAPLL